MDAQQRAFVNPFQRRFSVKSQHNNQRLFLKQRLVIVLLCVVLYIVLCGLLISCSPPLPSGSDGNSATPTPGISPIASNVLRPRVVFVLINTPPIFSLKYVRETEAMIAARALSYINPGEGGLDIFVSWITSSSVGQSAWSMSAPAIPADQQQVSLLPTPEPSKYSNQYDYANAQATVTSANATATADWQEQLALNHMLRNKVLAQVKLATDTLKSLTPLTDLIADDLLGGLFEASQALGNFNRNWDKYLIIASPLINNTLVNQVNASNINLQGVHTRVLFASCIPPVASVCASNNAKYEELLRSYGVRDIQIFGVQQSETLQVTF
jgi:hypothetical protein